MLSSPKPSASRSSEDADDVFQFLCTESLFAHVGDKALKRLAELGRVRNLSEGKRLFSAGQECHELHFVMEGRAQIFLLSEDGRERLLHVALPGDIVGAVSFFDGNKYPCTLVTETDCRFLAFRRRELIELLTSEGEVTLAILGGLVARQRRIITCLEEVSFENTSARLWHYLLENSRPQGNSRARRDSFPRVLEDLPTRDHIASAIGTVREVVSRRLSHFIHEGLVKLDGKRLTLLRPLD